MAYGIKISKSGKSASSSDVLDLVISTQYPVHKVKVEGENSLTLGSSDTTKSYTITHNLGYKAITWVFIDDVPGGSSRFKVPCYTNNGMYPYSSSLEYGTNDTTLTVLNYNTGSSRTLYFYYYVFYDEI